MERHFSRCKRAIAVKSSADVKKERLEPDSVLIKPENAMVDAVAEDS